MLISILSSDSLPLFLHLTPPNPVYNRKLVVPISVNVELRMPGETEQKEGVKNGLTVRFHNTRLYRGEMERK